MQESAETMLNLPIPFVVELSLVGKSPGGMSKINLCNNPKDKELESQACNFPIRNVLEGEDTPLLINNICQVIKNCLVELPKIKFTAASAMIKGKVKTN